MRTAGPRDEKEVAEVPTVIPERNSELRQADIEVIRVAAEVHRPSSVQDTDILDHLRARFTQALRLSNRLLALTRSLEARGLRYCVFGGWVRDTIYELLAPPAISSPRDIDLVVRGTELECLLQLLPSDVRSTMFGGIQSNAEPIAFDIWPLHETFLIRYMGLAPTFEGLLQSTDFTINAGLFFPCQRVESPALLDGGMLEALRTRTLAFNGPFLPFPVMQCARLAAYAGKLSLNLTPPVQEFMEDVLADPVRREQVLLGLGQNYPPSTADRGRQVIERITGRLR